MYWLVIIDDERVTLKQLALIFGDNVGTVILYRGTAAFVIKGDREEIDGLLALNHISAAKISLL